MNTHRSKSHTSRNTNKINNLADDCFRNNKKTSNSSSESTDSNWIAEVSHELRLPIANIRLLIETLLLGGLEDQAITKRMLLRASEEVERLQSLVSDLLSVEQLSASRDEAQADWQYLFAKAEYAVETTKKLAHEAGVSVLLDITRDFRIYANAEQLNQVLLNLLENAIKFTSVGGTVTIRSGKKPGAFAVEDTGIGIPASEIPKIFQRFYRVDRAKTRGSTGLGLSIVKNIADLHGAKISVSSEEGKGSIFFLEFPSPHSGASTNADSLVR